MSRRLVTGHRWYGRKRRDVYGRNRGKVLETRTSRVTIEDRGYNYTDRDRVGSQESRSLVYLMDKRDFGETWWRGKEGKKGLSSQGLLMELVTKKEYVTCRTSKVVIPLRYSCLSDRQDNESRKGSQDRRY